MSLVGLAVRLQGVPSLGAVGGEIRHVDVHYPQRVLPVPHFELYHSNPAGEITGVGLCVCVCMCVVKPL